MPGFDGPIIRSVMKDCGYHGQAVIYPRLRRVTGYGGQAFFLTLRFPTETFHVTLRYCYGVEKLSTIMVRRKILVRFGLMIRLRTTYFNTLMKVVIGGKIEEILHRLTEELHGEENSLRVFKYKWVNGIFLSGLGASLYIWQS